MTPQLQQAIRLLQLSTLELREEIQQALESNLMLETEEEGALRNGAEDDKSRNSDNNTEAAVTDTRQGEHEINAESEKLPDELPVDSSWEDVYDTAMPSYSSGGAPSDDQEGVDYLAMNSAAPTLHDHLMWQLNLTPFGDTDRAVAETLIEAIDEDGYLTQSPADILAALGDDELELAEVEAVLHRIQHFDPAGTGARDLQECLLLQLRQLPPETPWLERTRRLLTDHFTLLSKQDTAQLKRRLRLNDEQLAEVTRLIRSLNPRPGGAVADSKTQYVAPDVFVSKTNGSWRVELNTEATPKLRINPDYAQLIRRADKSEGNQCLRDHMQEARWFIKSLVSRNETLLRVASKIVEFQRGFFEYGEEAMKPLVLRDIAEALEMHESTISRVTSQKYMRTPRGTFEFKYFFSSHVSTAGGGECSATAIRALIKKLVAAESPNKPLSDSKIANLLDEQGIQVARRTVAKYREALAIPPSNERKRLA